MKTGTFKDFDGYIIYDNGDVWSKYYKRFMTHNIMKNGYHRIPLYNKEFRRGKMFNVHRIVC